MICAVWNYSFLLYDFYRLFFDRKHLTFVIFLNCSNRFSAWMMLIRNAIISFTSLTFNHFKNHIAQCFWILFNCRLWMVKAWLAFQNSISKSFSFQRISWTCTIFSIQHFLYLSFSHIISGVFISVFWAYDFKLI